MTPSSKRLSTKFEEVQLIYKNKTLAKDRPSVKTPEQAYEIFIQNWNLDQISLLEEVKILLLDNSMKLMSIAAISKGGMTGALVDPRMIFATALKRRSHAIIMAHNHPTGNLKPSHADIKLSDTIAASGKVLGIQLIDHLIVTSDHYCSLASDGYMEAPSNAAPV
ncbi:hypothetical protein BFP97_06410 [Roseivirga sp. 4D4]|uniref:JAB domain-containing protein n=1 Tax=Roseivirga sp. 4D4 TaxID=1889784 RepID=UPI000852F421|nr:JAB domain-containing protein [Roseivirga sp. 4D4]OEK01164.1 hypothetical protein BFP97_06410 [Roseivirga sp. 4D4]